MFKFKSSVSGVAMSMACAAVLAVAQSASAILLIPDVQIEVGVMGDTQILSVGALPSELPNLFTSNGQQTHTMWDLNWDITVDPDPFINGVFGLTNNSGATQTFVLNVTLPIAVPVTPSSLIGGSVGGSVTDANNDGTATAANSGGAPLFDGLIDGASALSIINAPFSFSAPFAGGTANIPATNVGLPGPTIPGPAALNTIAINHTFTLTPGDTVALTSFFEVVVPEPASLGLFALGAGLIGLKSR